MFTKYEKKQLVLVGLLILVLLIFCSYVESFYTRKGTVKYTIDDLVVVEDECGYEWEFYGDNYIQGDEVLMLMDNNHTDLIIEDDVITHVKRTLRKNNQF